MMNAFEYIHVFALVAETYKQPRILAPRRFYNKLSPRGRRDDMLPADGSSTVAKIAVDLRPSANGSAVRTSLVARGG